MLLIEVSEMNFASKSLSTVNRKKKNKKKNPPAYKTVGPRGPSQ